jgi:hypothetical protein
MFGGLEMIRAVNRVMSEVTISPDESIPSATTARLPASSPTTIFRSDNRAFVTILSQDALMICDSRLGYNSTV